MSAKASGAQPNANGSASSRAHHDGSSGRAFTDEQKAAVIRVRRCKATAFYDILGIESEKTTVTENGVKKAYRKQSLLTHPDKNGYEGADEAFKSKSADGSGARSSARREKKRCVGSWGHNWADRRLDQWCHELSKYSRTLIRRDNSTRQAAIPTLEVVVEELQLHLSPDLQDHKAEAAVACGRTSYRPKTFSDNSSAAVWAAADLVAVPLVRQPMLHMLYLHRS